jgi:hypothetical protein
MSELLQRDGGRLLAAGGLIGVGHKGEPLPHRTLHSTTASLTLSHGRWSPVAGGVACQQESCPACGEVGGGQRAVRSPRIHREIRRGCMVLLGWMSAALLLCLFSCPCEYLLG